MGPAELAALVAREADAGVSGALDAVESSGLLVVDAVVARVASVPEGVATSLDEVVWQAEVVLHPDRTRSRTDDPGAAPLGVPSVLGSLPVRALRGAGDAWAEVLTAAGMHSIGELATASPQVVARLVGSHGVRVAELVGRARSVAAPWPDLPPAATAWGSVLRVALSDPATLPGDAVVAHAVWGRCLGLVAAVDADVLAGLPVTGLEVDPS